MKQFDIRGLTKYSYVLFFIIIMYVSFIIIKPFVSAIFTSVILSFLFYPLYKKINSKINKKTIASLITVFLVLIIILLPTSFIVNILFNEARSFSDSVDNFNIESIVSYPLFSSTPQLSLIIADVLKELSKFIISAASEFIISIPGKVLELFIIFFVMFYLFKDGKELFHKAIKSIPTPKKDKTNLTTEFSNVTHGIIYGILVAAILQGIAGTIGFSLFGINNALLWGVIMTILAIIPVVGPSFIWFPASIYFLATDHILKGILLLIYGFLIISPIDNIIKTKIISKKAKVHPIIILLGILGGIKLFGIIGIAMGPLFLSFMVIYFKLHLSEKS